MSSRPVWAEVSLGALRHNFRALQQYVGPPTTVCAVVKADAYGHGAVECARALEQAGAAWFGVTSAEEGIALRQGGVRGRILLLSGFWHGEAEYVVQQKLTPTIWEPWHIADLEAMATKLGVARQPIHLKIDTGMTRLGADLANVPALGEALGKSDRLELEGVFTHLASSEIVGDTGVREQLARFAEVPSLLQGYGLSPRYYHTANSGAVATTPGSWQDMVRPGIALYGYFPPIKAADGAALKTVPESELAVQLELQPALEWKTRIISVREVPAGRAVGYGGTYTTAQPTRVAILPVGYADGLHRALSNRGRFLVRGEYAPVLGLVSMDLTAVDVGHIPAANAGDEVRLIGRDGDRSVTPLDHATWGSTVLYEILCSISKRVPRKYVL